MRETQMDEIDRARALLNGTQIGVAGLEQYFAAAQVHATLAIAEAITELTAQLVLPAPSKPEPDPDQERDAAVVAQYVVQIQLRRGGPWSHGDLPDPSPEEIKHLVRNAVYEQLDYYTDDLIDVAVDKLPQ